VKELSGAAKVWLWDFERGSVPYDVLVLAMALLVLLLPDTVVFDPLRNPR
jgi:hypothetical protein